MSSTVSVRPPTGTAARTNNANNGVRFTFVLDRSARVVLHAQVVVGIKDLKEQPPASTPAAGEAIAPSRGTTAFASISERK